MRRASVRDNGHPRAERSEVMGSSEGMGYGLGAYAPSGYGVWARSPTAPFGVWAKPKAKRAQRHSVPTP